MKYNKIIMNGTEHYRRFDEATGFYEGKALTETELIQMLLNDVVDEVIVINKRDVEKAISQIPDSYLRDIAQSYLDYQERLIESYDELTTVL